MNSGENIVEKVEEKAGEIFDKVKETIKKPFSDEREEKGSS